MIKVHVISGFLGAGKTSLIKKLLNNIEGKIVVIENEFGEVGIDGDILERENYDVIEISEGCICCSLKTDFEESILSVIEDYRPEHIIIEPTGIGLLSDIMKVFSNEEIKDRCRLTLPITVVDPVEFKIHIEHFGGFFTDQIANAGIIVLSKTQFLGSDDIIEIKRDIRKINSHAEIIDLAWEDYTGLEYNDLLNLEYDATLGDIKYIDMEKQMKKDISSLSILNPRDFKRNELEVFLEDLGSLKYGNIIRAKGFLGGESKDLEFSFVRSSFTIEETEFKNRRKICLIGENIEKDKLLNLLKG